MTPDSKSPQSPLGYGLSKAFLMLIIQGFCLSTLLCDPSPALELLLGASGCLQQLILDQEPEDVEMQGVCLVHSLAIPSLTSSSSRHCGLAWLQCP
jgi:hypothetical protein